MSSSLVGGWNRGGLDNAVVFERDSRARSWESDNVMVEDSRIRGSCGFFVIVGASASQLDVFKSRMGVAKQCEA
jgi:hypothetical protein